MNSVQKPRSEDFAQTNRYGGAHEAILNGFYAVEAGCSGSLVAAMMVKIGQRGELLVSTVCPSLGKRCRHGSGR
ncbi:hypothetical protein RRG08_058480 [Elysia crispata]|uniref:Uncharacterized protein n=1 Tax=Elysia crispata TaxID=231223 RepID=A0AAE0Y7S7_9GAST|nr:hypothetical protein RRG08_058480 [Elysia crispata]